jgi:hypothetical protein
MNLRICGTEFNGKNSLRNGEVTEIWRKMEVKKVLK